MSVWSNPAIHPLFIDVMEICQRKNYPKQVSYTRLPIKYESFNIHRLKIKFTYIFFSVLVF